MLRSLTLIPLLWGFTAAHAVEVPYTATPLSIKTSQGKNQTLGDRSAGKYRLVFWYSNFCPPCYAMKSFLGKLEKECNAEDFEIVRVNINDSENTPALKALNIRGTPTLTLWSAKDEYLALATGFRGETQVRDMIKKTPTKKCGTP
ncbi:thioredoxin family protein [Bdellovibrio sp.]|uniref:thioredoxin family protein n=1 Tax=Bdellovibrio sp. TaxID=28201 RepID=UPI0032215D98